MTRKEYSFSFKATPMKLFATHDNRQGIYFIFRVPSIHIKISFHFPYRRHTGYSAHVKVGTEEEYPLKIDDRIFDRDYLLDWVRSFEDVLSGNFKPNLDGTKFLILPASVVDSLSSSGRKTNVDLRSNVNADWRVIEARKIHDMLISSNFDYCRD